MRNLGFNVVAPEAPYEKPVSKILERKPTLKCARLVFGRAEGARERPEKRENTMEKYPVAAKTQAEWPVLAYLHRKPLVKTPFQLQ